MGRLLSQRPQPLRCLFEAVVIPWSAVGTVLVKSRWPRQHWVLVLLFCVFTLPRASLLGSRVSDHAIGAALIAVPAPPA